MLNVFETFHEELCVTSVESDVIVCGCAGFEADCFANYKCDGFCLGFANQFGRAGSLWAMVKHLVNKAVSGDRALMQLLLEEIRLLEARAASSPSGTNLDEADREVMRQIQERMRHLMRGENENARENGTDAE